MFFSAEICITNTGNTQLGPVLYVYSDLDFYETPFSTNLLTEDLIGVCPYVLDNIPDGTLIVLLKDISNGCCIYISLEPTIDLCTICDLGFNVYSANTVSVITAGNLTGSCEDNITDYVVNWYGPDSSTEIQFTSGSGTTFSYDWTHPLTGTSSVFAPAGVYTPKIESVILNGVLLQEDFGALSDCFSAVTVEAFNCSNGNNTNPIFSTLSAYSHVIQFNNQSQGNVPPNLSAVFELSANTNFLAFAFQGVSVPDAIKFLFSGSSYSTPLVLEYIKVGSELTISNLDANSFPKSADTSGFFSKVLNLQDTVTVLPGDYLIIEIETDPINPNTDWRLYLKCLETFDCSKCIDTTPYKILLSSITGLTGSCGDINIQLALTGCTTSQNNSDDVFKYFMNPGTSGLYSNFLNTGGVITTPDLFFNSFACTTLAQPPGFGALLTCFSGSSQIGFRTYQPNSTSRIIEFKFQNVVDFNAYYNNFLDAMQYSGSSDSTNVNYYTRLILNVPTPEGSTPCGDSTTNRFYNLHPQTLSFQTGTTIENPYNYTFVITAVTITNNTSYTECDLGCLDARILPAVSQINNTVTDSNNNFTGTTTVSSRYVYPINFIIRFTGQTSSLPAVLYNNSINFSVYANQTYVASGTPLQNITTLSATTCDFSPYMYQGNNIGYTGWFQSTNQYIIELTNPSDVRDFRIMASEITNGQPSNLYNVLAYGFSGGSVYALNTTYIQT
jgi:hypothetical protein